MTFITLTVLCMLYIQEIVQWLLVKWLSSIYMLINILRLTIIFIKIAELWGLHESLSHKFISWSNMELETPSYLNYCLAYACNIKTQANGQSLWTCMILKCEYGIDCRLSKLYSVTEIIIWWVFLNMWQFYVPLEWVWLIYNRLRYLFHYNHMYMNIIISIIWVVSLAYQISLFLYIYSVVYR